jgi:hypothetical protein
VALQRLINVDPSRQADDGLPGARDLRAFPATCRPCDDAVALPASSRAGVPATCSWCAGSTGLGGTGPVDRILNPAVARRDEPEISQDCVNPLHLGLSGLIANCAASCCASAA